MLCRFGFTRSWYAANDIREVADLDGRCTHLGAQHIGLSSERNGANSFSNGTRHVCIWPTWMMLMCGGQQFLCKLVVDFPQPDAEAQEQTVRQPCIFAHAIQELAC